ncbi:acetyl-CoA C-acyltransferase [Phycisphaerales bacterium AB-hyl4]|uniref:Acetyl-CoA C-acyltransferase n=1 Tax=Natronomicrosphaera hydrolytica TaxID=3242702 RepID=A0ABV4UAE3_9BACT
MPSIVIVAAKRTVQGRFLGSLAKQSAVDLAVAAGRATLEGIDPAHIDQVIVGNVLAAGQGMNIARQIGVKLNIPIDKPAFTVNMMCASGLQAVMLAAQAVRAGEAGAVLCGGTESMSNAPYLLDRARRGYKLGDGVLVDCLLRDGLVDSFDDEHMGLNTERLADEYKLSREQQDAFAVQSQSRYQQAHQEDVFANERVSVAGLAHDEHPRADTTAQALAQLKPAFRADGSVTAGNAAGINDGAAMLLVCDDTTAQGHGWQPLARLVGWTSVGCDPQRMGLGPVHATRQLCDRHGWNLSRFDSIELNEAFAAQTLACLNEMNLAPNAPHVNASGGAIAMGHPIGASGARLVAHLCHRLAAGRARHGLATLCVGGGMGVAAALDAV